MKKIVIASNNPGKLREFADMLAPLGLNAIPQSEFNIPESAEPHATFIENALEKARHASRLTSLPALADDSGICAVALGGAPGVYSAHYANTADAPKSDTRNNEKLVHELAPYTDKRAYYVCTLVFINNVNDPRPIIAEGECWGEIIATPRGQGGFGYDPYFYMPRFGCTAAELDTQTKNRVSHRGIALAVLFSKLKQQRAFSD
jgi:XTP/dITP diphosphohydrolase